MKINVLLAQVLLCSTLISCGGPITGNNPDVDENGTDSIPAVNDTPNDSVPTDTIDPNMPETLALDSTWVRKRAGSAYGKDLAEAICTRKEGIAPQQTVDFDEMFAASGTNLDLGENFYGDEDFDMEDFDPEGFDMGGGSVDPYSQDY